MSSSGQRLLQKRGRQSQYSPPGTVYNKLLVTTQFVQINSKDVQQQTEDKDMRELQASLDNNWSMLEKMRLMTESVIRSHQQRRATLRHLEPIRGKSKRGAGRQERMITQHQTTSEVQEEIKQKTRKKGDIQWRIRQVKYHSKSLFDKLDSFKPATQPNRLQ